MKFASYLRRGLSVGAILTGAFAMLLSVTTDGGAAQRKVMFEEFTSTTCPPCRALAPTLEQVWPQVANICCETVYHMNWPGAGTDPWNRGNQGDNGGSGLQGGRCAYYGVQGVPDVYIDGVASNARSEAALLQAIRNRANQASPATISLTGEFDGSAANGGNLTVHVEVNAESAINTVLYINLNEQQWHYAAEVDASWDEHFHPMIKMIPNWQGTAVRLNAGESYQHDFRISMNGIGWHRLDLANLEIASFLEDANKTVLQSEKIILYPPFPEITMADWGVTDAANGNGDGRIEPGETADMWFTLANRENYHVADFLKLEVTTEDPEIEILSSSFERNGLEGGAQADNEANPIRFSVPEGLVPHPVTFKVTITAQPGNLRIEQDLKFMVGWPPFLVVDASNNASATAKIYDLFGVNPLPWCDRWDHTVDGAPPAELLTNYKVVFWHAFNNQAPISEYEAGLLTGYLDQGGKLVISGSNVPEALSQTALFTEYLGVSVNNTGISQPFIHGVTNDPQFGGCFVFAGGGAGAGTPSNITSFNVGEGAHSILYYNSSKADLQTHTGELGVVHETATYSTMVVGFPIESIGTAVGSEGRAAFMNRVWNWVQGAGNSVGDDQVAGPVEFSLDAAYPNPFNSTTLLSFGMPVSGEATLAVYDLSGRNVATLLDGVIAAGRQSVSIDATAYGLGAGVYYAKLESAGQTKSTKLLYLK